MSYLVRSVGAWRDPDDVRVESTERLAHALAIFGAEATLRHEAGRGTVSLMDGDGVELLAYHREELTVTVDTGMDDAPEGGLERWWVQRITAQG